mmetsp:Transcript_28568/g.74033  ORF Transcript_28568/g.74033 Transcript_28568/m.74033 type:complete len:228 (-) Transcript_28568:440-1123(-)
MCPWPRLPLYADSLADSGAASAGASPSGALGASFFGLSLMATLTIAGRSSFSPIWKPRRNSSRMTPSSTSSLGSCMMASWISGSKGCPIVFTAVTPRFLKISTIWRYSPWYEASILFSPSVSSLRFLLASSKLSTRGRKPPTTSPFTASRSASFSACERFRKFSKSAVDRRNCSFAASAMASCVLAAALASFTDSVIPTNSASIEAMAPSRSSAFTAASRSDATSAA